MPADHDADDSRPFPSEPLGEVAIKLEIDDETYQRARAEFGRARRADYEHGFAVFVQNHCSVREQTVLVDGEPVDDVLDE